MRQGYNLLKWIISLLVALFVLSNPVRVYAYKDVLPFTETGVVVHVLYFFSTDCEHCMVVEQDVLTPLAAQYGAQLDIKKLEIGVAANYELLIRAEQTFAITADQRDIPTLIIGERVLIGEAAIREQLPGLITDGLSQGGVDWPALPGLDTAVAYGQLPFGPVAGDAVAVCEEGAEDTCATAEPIWMAYFYQVGCQECSRVEADVHYIQQRYPQLIVEEFNINDDAALAQWLAERVQRLDDLHSPALFVGDDVLIGDVEVTPQALEALMEKYATSGAEAFWTDFDPSEIEEGLVERFKSLGPLTVAFAGLVDGLNPCAFATLVFFVSYLTISGRTGRDALVVGAAFTIGVFLAYLLIGLGFYQILDLLGNVLTTVGRWVYALTALLCAVLAVVSFTDFLKARQGDLKDMSLNLPHALRMRINQVIRKGRHARAFVLGAFLTGIIISFLELACTGQIYLPTIIFVASKADLRVRAIAYLLLYNLLFILPLVVVFVLAYYGTTSKDLTRFLKQRAPMVKLGMTMLFAALSLWLGASLLS